MNIGIDWKHHLKTPRRGISIKILSQRLLWGIYLNNDFHRSSSRDVRLSVCLFVPFPCDFFNVLKSKGFRCGILLFINIIK